MARLTAAWLAQVRALSAPGAPPGAPALWERLDAGHAPPAAWLRLAQALHAAWLKGDAAPEPARCRLFAELAAHAWPMLSAAERLASPVGAALARAFAALDDGPALSRLAACLTEDLSAPPAPDGAGADLPEPAQAAIAVVLRQLRQRQDTAALRPLLRALRPRWPRAEAWCTPALAAVSALARQADDLDTLRDAAEWVVPWCEAARAAPVEDGPARLARWIEPGRLALRTLQVGPMQEAADALLAAGGLAQEDSAALLVQLLEQLAAFAADDITRALLDRAAGAGGHAGLRHALARLAHAEGAPPERLRELLGPLDVNQPGGAAALGWLAGVCFHQGDERGAIALYRQLEAKQALSPIDRLRLGHLRARDDSGFLPTSPVPPDAPVPAPDDEARATRAEREAWPEDVLAPFSAGLAPLRGLLAQPPTHASRHSADDLAAAGQASLADWQASLAAGAQPSLQSCARLAKHLAQLADAAYGHHARWPQAYPFTFGPPYGAVDPARCRALHGVVQQHIVALCGHALERPHALRGGAGVAGLRHVAQLSEQRAQARWELGQAQQALADLDRLDGRLGRLAARPRQALRLRALLTAGELQQARCMLDAPDDDLQVMREWDAWLQAEGATADPLVVDLPCEGSFETVSPDGRLHRHPHRLAPTGLWLARLREVGVRQSHLLLGGRGGLLRPAAWHLSMGEYPYDHPGVRRRGGPGATAAVLAAPRWQRLDTPVVVLANMDATYHRNYYHWVVLLLARIDALRRAGLVSAARPLLLPRALSAWMHTSLAAIGLAAEAVRHYDDGDDLLLSDAWVASPLEHASPALLDGLRRTLLRGAGVDPDAAPPADGPLLYISRRGEGRRPLVEESSLEALAGSLGFTLVAPETLALPDQVRLFASARGIAGPPGAAYTNLLWAAGGTRVLSIFKEEANLPTFVDLSLLRGQSHRWLQGRNLPGYALMSVVNAPFSVDLALAERELRWVAGARR